MTPDQRLARTSQAAALPVCVVTAALLFATRDGEAGLWLASLLCLLALPWVVAALIALAVLSSPLYMALHPLQMAPTLEVWLGGVMLLAIAVGVQINAGLLLAWLRRPRRAPEPGLREFWQRERTENRAKQRIN